MQASGNSWTPVDGDSDAGRSALAVYVRFSWWAGVTVVALGVLVLFGWSFELEVLKRVRPGYGATAPLTAVAFLLAGAALLLLLPTETAPPRRWAGRALAAAVTLTGLLTIAQYLLSVDLGIDRILFPRTLAESPMEHPGRPSPQGAAALVLCGAALLLLTAQVPRRYVSAQLAAIAAGFFAFQPLAGYLYDVEAFVKLGPHPATALHSALGFVVLSLGIVCARPDRGLMVTITADSIGGYVARRLVPAAILVPLILGLLGFLAIATGLLDVVAGYTTVIVLSTVAFVTIVWWNAAALRRLDTRRATAAADRARVLARAEADRANLHAVLQERERLLAREKEARAEAARRAREEAALRRAAEDVSATFTVEEVMVRIAATALEATAADGAFVHRIHPGEAVIEIVAAGGDHVPPLGHRDPFGGSATARVVTHGEVELFRRAASDPEGVPDDLARHCPDCSALVVPLSDAGEAIGSLTLVRASRRAPFHADEVQRAQTFARLASLAFRKINLLESSERRRDELQRVLESRSRLVRGFSHDVKNPLGAADGYLALLEDGALDGLAPKQRSGVARARRSIASAMRLIDSLVEIARAEAGQLRIEYGITDLRSVASEVAEEYRPGAEAKGLDLSIEIPRVLPPVLTDADRVRQVLGNLLSNAVKYTDEGRVSVRLAWCGDGDAPQPGRWVCVAVSDTGPGIPRKDQEEVFGEFTRLQPGKGRGAGLGLAISRRIARLLGGEVTLESMPGRGSRFTLWLPHDTGSRGPVAEDQRDHAALELAAPAESNRASGGRAAEPRGSNAAGAEGVAHALSLRGTIHELAVSHDAILAVERIADLARRRTDADGAFIEQVDHLRYEVEVVARAGKVAPGLRVRMPYPGSLCESVLGQGRPEIIDDLTTEQRPVAAHLGDECKACQALVAPLIWGGDALGALVLLRRSNRNPFTDADAKAVRALVDLGAIAFQRTVLAEQSERRRQALEASEARFRALAETSAVGVFVADANATIDYLNPAAARIFGFAPDDLIGSSIMRVIPDDPDGTPQEPLRQCLESSPDHPPGDEIELVGRTRDGRDVPLDVSFGVFESGGRRYFTGIVRDLSARRATEQERERLLAEQRLLADVSIALASSLDYDRALHRLVRIVSERLGDWSILYVEGDGRLRRVAGAHRNPRKQTFVDAYRGYDLPADSGAPVAEVFRTGEAAVLPEVSESTIETVTAGDPEQAAILRELGTLSAMIVPLTARGRTLGVLTVVSSESGRVYGPQDLEWSKELGRRAAIVIDNARLYQAAEAANKAKSDFLAVMSHELRTPLTAILGYADLLEAGIDGPVTKVQKAKLQRIKASSNHLRNLIEEILTFSRLESGRETVRHEVVDIAELARSTAELVEPAAREKGLALRVDVSAEPLMAKTDPSKVRRILLNLLSNAVSFTDSGEIRLQVERQADAIACLVTDTGIGVAPDALDRIFEPFWQEERGLTREVGGTGLGLTVARRLARMLGGDVTVESRVGAGSTFTVTLPDRPSDGSYGQTR